MRDWKALILRGGFSILFGLLAFASPVATLAALSTFFAVYLTLIGVMALMVAYSSWPIPNRQWFVVEGVLGVVFGFSALLLPGLSLLSLLFLISAWALSTGLAQISTAYGCPFTKGVKAYLGLSGLGSIVLALFMIFNPTAGLITLAYIAGAYALFIGLLSVGAALELRRGSSWGGQTLRGAT